MRRNILGSRGPILRPRGCCPSRGVLSGKSRMTHRCRKNSSDITPRIVKPWSWSRRRSLALHQLNPMLTQLRSEPQASFSRIPSTRGRPPSGVPLPVPFRGLGTSTRLPTGTTSEIVSTPGRTRHPGSRHGRLVGALEADRVDTVVVWPVSLRCPQCGRKWCIKGPIRSRTLQDLVFGRASLKDGV